MINVCMLVHDRPKLTRQAIFTLLDHPSGIPLTLTIVDDDSAAPTQAILDAAATLPKVYVVSTSGGIVGANRNLSVTSSELKWGRGEALYLTDSDAYFPSGWLGRLLSVWTLALAHGFKLLGAYNHPFNGPIAGTSAVPGPPLSGLRIEEVNAVGGFSQMMTWETWDRWGPFNQPLTPGPNQSEDWDFCQRLRRDGYKVGVVYPHLVYNCGITSSDGTPCPGAEYVKAEVPEGVYAE